GVEDSERKSNEDEQRRQACDLDQHLVFAAKPKEIQHDGNDDQPADCEQHENDGQKRKCQRQEVELKEAAPFRLVVDQVQGIEERFHSGIGAPQRDQQTDDKGEAESRSSLRGYARDLVSYHLNGSARHQVGNAVEVRRDGAGSANNPYSATRAAIAGNTANIE